MTRNPRALGRAGFVVLVLTLALAPRAGRAQEDAPSADDPGPSDDHSHSGDVRSASPIAQRLFADLVCMCGTCQRLTLAKCGCGYAAEEREKIVAMLAERDISTPAAQEKAYVEIRDAFIKQYGGQHVLTVPLDKGFNKLGWIVPWAVFVAALGLVFWVGRPWVQRGRAETRARQGAATASGAMAASGATKSAADEDREDRLDDELRDID